MKSRSSTLEGFRAVLCRPSFGLAEIAWRWSFGSAAGLLLTLALFEYLNTLPVSRGDLALLGTKHPILISQAIGHILRGSGFRLLEAILVLALTLGAAWIGIASLAQAVTLKALLAYFREGGGSLPDAAPSRLRALFGLNFLRLGAALAAAIGCLAAIVLGGAVTSPGDPSTTLLIFLTVALLVWLAWSVVSWYLSLAAVFVVVRGRDTFGAMAAAVELCCTRAGAIFAAGTWFGLAHFVAFVLATSVVAFPLGLAGVLPHGMVLGGVLLITLLYFAVVDFLHAGRLAAYVAMLELPAAPVAPTATPVLLPIASAVDPTELILGDVPLAPGN